jgi:hypothetical protein
MQSSLSRSMVGSNEKEFLKVLKDTQKKFNTLMLANEKQMKQLQIQLKGIDTRQKEIITTLNKVSKSIQNTNLSKDLKLALKNINLSAEVGRKIQNLNMSVEFAKALEDINLSDELCKVVQNIDISKDIRDAIKKFELSITQNREGFESERTDDDEDGDDEEGNKITNQNAEDNGFLAEGKQEYEEGNKNGEDEDEHDDKDVKNT